MSTRVSYFYADCFCQHDSDHLRAYMYMYIHVVIDVVFHVECMHTGLLTCFLDVNDSLNDDYVSVCLA